MAGRVTDESSVERQARYRAELTERDVVEKRAALKSWMAGLVKADDADRGRIECLLKLFAAVQAGLPRLIEISRAAATEREAVIDVRAWWRELRQRESDKARAEADALPEPVPYRWDGGEK